MTERDGMHSYDLAVLRAAGGPALAAGAVACATCAVVAGVPGLLGAALATAVTGAVFSLTLWLCSRTRTLRPGTVTTVALLGYAVMAVILGVLLAATAGLKGLSSAAVAAGLVVGTLAWMVGEVRAVARLRLPYVEPEGWPTSGADAPARRTGSAA